MKLILFTFLMSFTLSFNPLVANSNTLNETLVTVESDNSVENLSIESLPQLEVLEINSFNDAVNQGTNYVKTVPQKDSSLGTIIIYIVSVLAFILNFVIFLMQRKQPTSREIEKQNERLHSDIRTLRGQ
jgi:predicted PurR-regulated permease PerM